MEYKIYTLPNCNACKTIKDYLNKSNIEFTEVNLGDDEGVLELRKIYTDIKDKIKRVDNEMVIPLITISENNKIIKVANTIKEIKMR